MENVTYYVGAGASVAALPVYNDFKKRLQLFSDLIFYAEKGQNESFKTCSAYYRQVLDELIEALDGRNNTTLDILAHELKDRHHSNGKLDLSSLKYLISDFFVFEQLVKKTDIFHTREDDSDIVGLPKLYDAETRSKVYTSIDPRYKNFILPHLNGNGGNLGRLQNHIKVISWNYDLQFELCYARCHTCSIDLAQQNLQVYPSPSTLQGLHLDNSAIVKLNGSAGIYYADNRRSLIRNSIYERSFDLNQEYIEIMIRGFYRNRLRVFDGLPFFKFYFETEHPFQNQVLTYAKEIIKNTKTLVVIGYTFHPSNRSIDKEVLGDASHIEKVILQVLPNDLEDVKYNLTKVNPVLHDKIIPYPSLREFPPINNI